MASSLYDLPDNQLDIVIRLAEAADALATLTFNGHIKIAETQLLNSLLDDYGCGIVVMNQVLQLATEYHRQWGEAYAAGCRDEQ